MQRNRSNRSLRSKKASSVSSSVSKRASSSKLNTLSALKTASSSPIGNVTRSHSTVTTRVSRPSTSTTITSPQSTTAAAVATRKRINTASTRSFQTPTNPEYISNAANVPQFSLKLSEPQLSKDAQRKGFDLRLLHNGKEPSLEVTVEAPRADVVILPASSKIGRKYVEDIRSGKVILNMYKNLTKPAAQPIYTPSFSYVHSFRIHERNHREFLKRIALIETKLTQRFGSTYYLHVGRPLKKFRHKWTVLRSAFVHKKAQDTYEYKQNEYTVKVSYAFAITDPEINDFIYNQLKKTILAAGGAHSFGYTISHWTEKQRESQFTPLSHPVLETDGVVEEIPQVKYSNYVGHQEMLRKYCEDNGLNFDEYAGDPDLFPLREEILTQRRIAAQRLNIYDLKHGEHELGGSDHDLFDDSMVSGSDGFNFGSGDDNARM